MRPGFAEFFAGIGLVRLALEPLGWRCIFANDIDPKKAEMYRQNFPDEDLVVGDIFALRARDIPADASLWTASFPCIDLSLAGNRRGLQGTHSGAYWGFIKILEEARRVGTAPDRILLENVVGFVHSAGGADLAVALGALSNLGYRYDVIVLDAKYFTPQSRPRLFIVAEQESSLAPRLLPSCLLEPQTPLRPLIIRRFIAAHPSLDWGYLPLPPPRRYISELDSIIEDLPEDHSNWWTPEAVAKLLDAMSQLNRSKLKRMLVTGCPQHATIYRRVRNGRTMAEMRCDGLAGCLRTPRGGSSKQFLLETRDGAIRVRNLTVRECARLQGVPDGFRLDVPANQAWFGLGDAVCVPAVRWLAEQFCPPQPPRGSQLPLFVIPERARRLHEAAAVYERDDPGGLDVSGQLCVRMAGRS